MSFRTWLNENSTEDAAETLDAIIGTLKDADSDDSKEILDMANGIKDYYKKNGSFSPGQAKWIYNTSKSLFK
jgi:hypothetical protein